MAANTKRVTTATLIRGQVYTLRHPDYKASDPIDPLRFEYNVPVVVNDERIAQILENIYDEVVDGEGETYEKPRFKVERGVAPPEPVDARKPKRLSADRPIRRRRARAS